MIAHEEAVLGAEELVAAWWSEQAELDWKTASEKTSIIQRNWRAYYWTFKASRPSRMSVRSASMHAQVGVVSG